MTASAQLRASAEWVEVEMALSPSGNATVQYKVHWRVESGTMAGFFFQGERGAVQWHRPACRAEVNEEHRYDLDLRRDGDRWDVVLADNQRFGPGEITYVLTYFPDPAIPPFAVSTSSENENLIVFNWAPVQWDQLLDHQTVLVRLPIKVEKSEMSLTEVSELGLRIEPPVNQQYELSFVGRRDVAVTIEDELPGQDQYLAVRVQKNNVAAKEEIRLRFSVPDDVFEGPQFGAKVQSIVSANTQPVEASTPKQDRMVSSGWYLELLLLGGLVVSGLSCLLLFIRRRP